MMTQIRQHLEATVTGTGPIAGLRALQNLYGMTGTEIAFSLGRDRTMVSLYVNGHKDMPGSVIERLAETLQSCLATARQLRTNSESEDELLAAVITRTQEILNSL